MTPHRRPGPRRLATLGLALSTLGAGCGGAPEGRVPVHPARGAVLFEGKPLPGARVVLVSTGTPTDQDPPSPSATTADDGTFELATYDRGDGAPAGDYLVKVATSFGGGESNPLARAKARADVLRGRFGDPRTSGLKATIKPGPNELPPFDLK